MYRPSQTTSTKCQYQAAPSKPKWRSGVKWPFMQPDRDEQQHQHADEHVEAVEAGQHEEGRAVGARAQLQVQLAVGMHVLVGLEAQERDAEQHRQPHEDDRRGRDGSATSAWCAIVTVTPELSRMAVLMVGIGHGPMVANGSTMPAGEPV